MSKLMNDINVGYQRYIEVYNHCKVINRKKYDTATSELLMCEYVESSMTDPAKLILLFRKKNGEYFSYSIEYLSYEIDCRYVIDDWNIIPLSEDEAKDLVEKYGEGFLYIKLFGEVEE